MKKLPLICAAMGIGLLAASPASASVATITFTGTTYDNGAGGPWGLDAYGANIVGLPYSASFTFDSSKGTTDIATGSFVASGGYTGSYTIGGHGYAATGTTYAEYLRTSNFIEVIVYDDPNANTGVVMQAITNHTGTLNPNLFSPLPTLTLNPADVATSFARAVLRQNGGVLRADGTIGTVSVSAVPEASTWAMMLLGFAGLGFVGYRRATRSAIADLQLVEGECK